MDNSIFSSFSGTHKMLTRYKKHYINTRKKDLIISDISDEDYDPSKDKFSSATSSSSSLNVLDEVDENELKLLISDAKRIISTIAEKYIGEEDEDDNTNDDDEEDIDEEDIDEEDDDDNTNDDDEEDDNEDKLKFTGLEILDIDNIRTKKNKKLPIIKEIDKDYLQLLNQNKNKCGNKTRASYVYFKKLEETNKKNILSIEKNIKNINQGLIPIRFKILDLPVDISIKAQIMRRLDSLEAMDESSSDYHKIDEWLSTLLSVPFNKYYKLPVNKDNSHTEIQEYLINIKNILDKSIYGHNDAKFQIIQLVTQWITNPKSKGKIIGLQGPMGNGKTTLVKDGICNAIDRPFASIPLGGASDASLLEGHSYTYEGSVCGQIVKVLIESKCMNPVIYFDELDKVSECTKGKELINKLIHLTDHSQNDEFTDIYFSGIKFDLSRALFIFSFNDETKLNPILKDRIHIVKMKGLKIKEKNIIAKNYLIPTLCKEIGFYSNDILINENIIEYIITNYTKEEGVRSLKRCIENIISKINILRYITDKDKINIPFMIDNICFPLKIDKSMVDKLLIRDKPNVSFMMYT